MGRPHKPECFDLANCQNCGCEFSYRKLDRAGKFCSRDCYYEYTRKNSNNYRVKAFANFDHICSCCGCDDIDELIVHHIDGNRLNNALDNLQILCRKCHNHIHKDSQASMHRNKISQPQIERGFCDVLWGLKIDVSDPNFIDTPRRVAKAYMEIFEGLTDEAQDELKNQLSVSFPSDYDQVITIPHIRAWSMCPHHFLPVKYSISAAYLPGEKILGLSKIPRFIELLAKRPVLQEQLTYDIVDYFEKYASPKGCICVVHGEHMCMQMRGVKTNAATLTITAKGLFLENKDGIKDEFLSLIRGK